VTARGVQWSPDDTRLVAAEVVYEKQDIRSCAISGVFSAVIPRAIG
jgi:hypothetical protein